MKNTAFIRVASVCAILSGIGGVLYGVAFVILGNQLLYSVLLMLGGLLTSVVLVALHDRLHESDAAWSMLAILFGLIGSIGSVIHGGYDLANAIHPPVTLNTDLPSQIDPRGLLTFGLLGMAVLIFSALMRRGNQFPKNLASVGTLLGVLMIVIYLGRLIILDPTNSIVRIALLLGVIVNTIWLIWLGLTWRWVN
jgi:hypothetical protein